jgi:hypothetical protein
MKLGVPGANARHASARARNRPRFALYGIADSSPSNDECANSALLAEAYLTCKDLPALFKESPVKAGKGTVDAAQKLARLAEIPGQLHRELDYLSQQIGEYAAAYPDRFRAFYHSEGLDKATELYTDLGKRLQSDLRGYEYRRKQICAIIQQLAAQRCK